MSDQSTIPKRESPDTPCRCGGRRPSCCSATRDEKLTAMIDWLTQYQEGWHGPKEEWTTEVRADFDGQAGFLMMFIDGYKFTKQNAKAQAGDGREGHSTR